MILCAILLILLYSITLTPTIYIDLCIFLFAVIIYNIKKVAW